MSKYFAMCDETAQDSVEVLSSQHNFKFAASFKVMSDLKPRPLSA